MRSLDDQRKRPGPKFAGESQEGIRDISHERHGLLDRVDQDRQGLCFRPSLYLEDAFDGRQIKGIGGEAVKRVGRNSNYTSPLNEACGVVDYVALGRFG